MKRSAVVPSAAVNGIASSTATRPLAVLASLDGHQRPTETFGQGFLRQAGALPQLVQRRGDGAMFGLALLGDATGHAAMFKGPARETRDGTATADADRGAWSQRVATIPRWRSASGS
jgi:hypothetical protein